MSKPRAAARKSQALQFPHFTVLTYRRQRRTGTADGAVSVEAEDLAFPIAFEPYTIAPPLRCLKRDLNGPRDCRRGYCPQFSEACLCSKAFATSFPEDQINLNASVTFMRYC